MTAVANPPSFQQQLNRPAWSSNGQGALNSMHPDEVARMFMPRKSTQRATSSSSLSSNASTSSTGTAIMSNTSQQSSGPSTPGTDVGTWTSAGPRKKPQRTGPWAINKAEPISGVTTTRPQSILAANGVSAASSITSMQQPHSVVPSQHLQTPTQQQNGARPGMQSNDGNPVLYLLSMNGTFERKTISVPYYPDNLRIGRQTNAKTVPTPTNGFFDSKVLSRQHAEIWADRSGKVWIRDVRSSNGTFVNGTRLSAENRDSEPHELQSQDHLELGIDIVSEDQKTVVHHKVAAKVEHAGFLGATTNVLDMSFGDLDPANGALMLPSQNGMLRGRMNSQGSMISTGRGAGAGAMNAAQQRPMNFWLTPITTEQIVKRLTNEMRQARLQDNDLTRTEQFLDTLLTKKEFKEEEKVEESTKQQLPNGVPFKMDAKPRFSDPPAPPPQQPLPEKPDAPRIQTPEASLKRSNTERPRSVPATSPVKQESSSQIVALLEALTTAKKEIESQSERMRDLEEMLQKEREARQTAEELAKRLETAGVHMNGVAKGGSIVEEAFEPPLEPLAEVAELARTIANDVDSDTSSAESVQASTNKMQEKLEQMMFEMREIKQQMETYRQRAETAEAERDEGRKTLAEMVEKIRADELARLSTSTQRSRSASVNSKKSPMGIPENEGQGGELQIAPEYAVQNGTAVASQDIKALEHQLAVAMPPSPSDQHRLLYNSAPYASMLGVVLLGMGLMAYMNGWQKVER